MSVTSVEVLEKFDGVHISFEAVSSGMYWGGQSSGAGGSCVRSVVQSLDGVGKATPVTIRWLNGEVETHAFEDLPSYNSPRRKPAESEVRLLCVQNGRLSYPGLSVKAK